jgi:hypothetical protein
MEARKAVPEVLARLRMGAPEFGGAAVVIGDAASGVGRIDGGGERLEQVTEGLLLLAQFVLCNLRSVMS